MLVVDASALVDVLARTPRGDRVTKHLATEEPVVAPELVDVEVLSALARLQRAGAVGAATADRGVALLASMPMRRISHTHLTDEVWQLREHVRIADAFYLACARVVGGTLLTTDARLGRAPVPEVTVTVVS